MRAMPVMPPPPTPMKCTRPKSPAAGVDAFTPGRLPPRESCRPVPRPRRADPNRPPAPTSREPRRVVSSGITVSGNQPPVSSASATIRPPPAVTIGAALNRCSPLPCGSGTKTPGGRRPSARHRSSHPPGTASDPPRRRPAPCDPCRAARRSAGSPSIGAAAARRRSARARRRAAPARPPPAGSDAAAAAALFNERAPWDPPKTSSVGASGDNPKLARASARRPARSSVLTARRNGMPNGPPAATASRRRCSRRTA